MNDYTEENIKLYDATIKQRDAQDQIIQLTQQAERAETQAISLGKTIKTERDTLKAENKRLREELENVEAHAVCELEDASAALLLAGVKDSANRAYMAMEKIANKDLSQEKDKPTHELFGYDSPEEFYEACDSPNPLLSDYVSLKTAARNLLEACEHQDNCENLCEKIDGDLLNDLREAIYRKHVTNYNKKEGK